MVPRRSALLIPCFLGHRDIHGQKDRRRGVDGHGGADLVEGDPFEEELHIGQGIDGHAHFAHFALRQGMIGIISDLGGQIEGDRKPGLPLFQKEFIPPVGLFRRGKPGILAHGPDPPPVHGRLDAARKRVFPGKTLVFEIIRRGNLCRGVENLNIHSRGAFDFFRSFLQTAGFPFFLLIPDPLFVHPYFSSRGLRIFYDSVGRNKLNS